MTALVRAFAPGRVNLIGDHTDHTDGFCLPMAVSMGITVEGAPTDDVVVLHSAGARGVASIALDVDDPSTVEPEWARYVAGVIAELRPAAGLRGTIDSDLPMGAGLSSSAALEVASALALGFDGSPLELARLCQRAEQVASGVPCGILDQISSVGGVDGHALVVDCQSLELTPVRVPDDLEIVVVHSGEERTLVGSAYADRRAECEEAQARIGALRDASMADADALEGGLRRRARHVISENQRVHAAAAALVAGDHVELGRLFNESHASMRDDFENSTPVIDAVVERLTATEGVYGARMTGGGWGGCVVAVTRPGALDEGWVVRPGPGATRLS